MAYHSPEFFNTTNTSLFYELTATGEDEERARALARKTTMTAEPTVTKFQAPTPSPKAPTPHVVSPPHKRLEVVAVVRTSRRVDPVHVASLTKLSTMQLHYRCLLCNIKTRTSDSKAQLINLLVNHA